MNQTKTKSVMHVDDDEDVRDVVRFALEENGYIVLSFPDAREALGHLQTLSPEDNPGLILVDYLMPHMNGIHFIEAIRKDHAHSSELPIALCSAKGEDEVPQTLPSGTLLLQKPMELDELLELVHRHCH